MVRNKRISNLIALLVRGLILLIVGALLYYGWQWLSPLLPSNGTQTTVAPSAAGLNINISDGDVFDDPVVEIIGIARPERQLTINGQPIPVGPDGSFNLPMRLAEGPNLIIVETFDDAGNIISLVRQVTYTPPGAEVPVQQVPTENSPWMMAAALLVILAAILLAVLRRRKPWIRISTDTPDFKPGSFNGETNALTIIVELDRTTRLSLYVLDDNGKRITTLLNNRSRSGKRHTFSWNGYGLSGDIARPGMITIVGEAGVPPSKTKDRVEVSILTNPTLHQD